MVPGKHRVYFWVAPILAVSWLSIALLNFLALPSGAFEAIWLGYSLGSLFGHVALAAGWAVFGPGTVLWRVPLSIVWVLLIGVAVVIEIVTQSAPPEIAITFTGCFLGIWLALQLPLWGIKLGFRAHLRYADDPRRAEPSQWQFGTRELLIVTTMVAVAFGIGRIVVGDLLSDTAFVTAGLPVLLFLALTSIAFSLLIMVAALLERGAIVGVLVTVGLIVLGTIIELPLLQQVTGNSGRPNTYDLLSVNGFGSGLVLLVATIVRQSGYVLARDRLAS